MFAYIHIHACLPTYLHAYIQIIHTYIHTYIHTFIHTYRYKSAEESGHKSCHTCKLIHTYIHAYMHTCIHEYIHTDIHDNIHTNIYIYEHWCVRLCVCVCVNVCASIYIYIYIYIHTCIHLQEKAATKRAYSLLEQSICAMSFSSNKDVGGMAQMQRLMVAALLTKTGEQHVYVSTAPKRVYACMQFVYLYLLLQNMCMHACTLYISCCKTYTWTHARPLTCWLDSWPQYPSSGQSPENEICQREVAAALESVLPRANLHAFTSLEYRCCFVHVCMCRLFLHPSKDYICLTGVGVCAYVRVHVCVYALADRTYVCSIFCTHVMLFEMHIYVYVW